MELVIFMFSPALVIINLNNVLPIRFIVQKDAWPGGNLDRHHHQCHNHGRISTSID